MLLWEIAQYLDLQGIGTAREGLGGNIFIEHMPSDPDSVIALYSTGGPPSDAKLGYDVPTVQIMVRGDNDPRNAYDTAQSIYETLHGFNSSVFVENGFYVVDCRAMQSGPIRLGTDDNGRYEYSLNFQLEIRNQSGSRE